MDSKTHVREGGSTMTPRERTLDEDWHRWLNRITTVLLNASRLLEATPEPEKLTPEAQHAYAAAALLTDRGSREIRVQKMRERWNEWQSLSTEERRSRLQERERRTAELKRQLGIGKDED